MQLIPTSFSNSYEAKPFYDGTGAKGSGTQIPILDARDWYLDYFNGILFQQDPPGTGDHSENPDYVEAYLYIGDMLNTVVAAGGGGGGGATGDGDPNAQYLVLQPTGSLSAERILNPTNGLSFTDSGAGNNYTIQIDDSIVATLTGSIFSGNVIAQSGLSGSLQSLSDGSPYIRSGAGISVVTGSSGEVTISTAGTSGLDRSKGVYFISSPTSAGSAVSVSPSDFSTANYDEDKIDIFVNGQLLHSGSSSQVSASERDYYVDTANSLKFAFDIVIDDIIDVIIFTVSS